MGLLNILLFLTASLACASANISSFGQKESNTELLVMRTGEAVDKTTVLNFNNDKKYDLTIHMVLVSFNNDSVECKLISGGQSTHYLTLEFTAKNGVRWVDILIFGVMNKDTKDVIEADDFKFTVR